MAGGREGAGLGGGSESGQGEAGEARPPWLEGQRPRAVQGGGLKWHSRHGCGRRVLAGWLPPQLHRRHGPTCRGSGGVPLQRPLPPCSGRTTGRRTRPAGGWGGSGSAMCTVGARDRGQQTPPRCFLPSHPLPEAAPASQAGLGGAGRRSPARTWRP
jgi:hypothetical protein